MTRQSSDGSNNLDDELQGLFARAADHITPRQDLAANVQQRLAQGGPVRPASDAHSPRIAATLSAFLVVALLVGVFVWFGPGSARPGAGGTPASVPFRVTSVDLSVSPSSIAGATCGSVASFTYTAVFHIPAQTAGGTIQFSYTLNNGRSQTAGTLTAAAGETSRTFKFLSSGALPPDHTYPGVAVVMVTSPNHISSPPAQPSGSCTAPGPFQVTGVSMTVNPASIAGMTCGTYLTVTYTTTFHLAPNGPGGTIHFDYTFNNGRGDNLASISVVPGQTTASYAFHWSGNLPTDHTYPEGGGVIVRSPDAVIGSLVAPSGACR